MLHHENSHGGGILADEMGLRKTSKQKNNMCITLSVETLALINNNNQHTLVLIPPILLHNWTREIQKWLPQLSLKVVGKSEQLEHLEQPQILLMSHYILRSVFQNPKYIYNCMYQWQWIRVILDEGHSIVNSTTKLFQCLEPLKSKQRWILSGLW